MSVHTKARHTRQGIYKVTIEVPGKAKKLTFVPAKYLQKLENFLQTYGESDSIAWETLAKDRIAKYKKAGLALRGARYREGLSQKALSKRTGISQENISKMENGQRPIGEKVAKKLAKALRIDFELLIEKNAM
ncbi:MAG TPA: helix-turn-helix transcriptional regulator [Rhabdochlamydiaceae bacterium]|nr:helix-turn-helix transcriptional regulator [Rhabdochlamydiaceae bacterium]